MTMNRLRLRAKEFLKDDSRGGATVEFVIIFPVMFFMIGFILLLAIDFFWMLTSQKAVERGAREAITRLPVAEVLVEQGRIINYDRVGSAPDGEPCEPGGNCVAVATYTCRGGSHINDDPTAACSATRFTEIYNEVLRLAPNTILPENLTITYEDSGLGRATESYIPLVTVELQQARPLSSFSFVDSFFAVGSPTQPTVAAALVGEGMGS